jgi:hypothetical protein
MAYAITPERPMTGTLDKLNTNKHDVALTVFMVIVLAHWAEHVLQAIQIWGLGMKPPQARGALGMVFPWLVTTEALHYGYALVMLIALWILRKGFVGRARQWWMLAFGIQFWHHIEHLSLLIQSWSGAHLNGAPVPTSFIQLLVPRVELHLFYNTIVFIPMVIALLLHRHPPESDRARMRCRCALGQYSRADF